MVIQIDDMIGAFALEYMMHEDNKEDDDFLMIRMTDVEYKFAERLVLLLMLGFSVWCSWFYYSLCNYTEGKDIYQLYCFGGVYLAFYIWPVFMLFYKVLCGCCITICCNPERRKRN